MSFCKECQSSMCDGFCYSEEEKLRAEITVLSENLAISNARAVELEAALRILQRYHWGDGTITREQVVDVLSGVKGSDDE